MEKRKTIDLVERERRLLHKSEIPLSTGEQLHRRYGKQLEIGFPDIRTGYQWAIQPNGWIGNVSVGSDLKLVITPKTPVSNVFRMIEYAYGFRSFQFEFDNLTTCASLEEFFEEFARILSRLVLERSKKGLIKKYLEKSEPLNVIRGRLNARHIFKTAWQTKLVCDYHDQSVDNEDNQIAAWALYLIKRTKPRNAQVEAMVTSAYRALAGAVTLKPIQVHTLEERHYHRLNEDYRFIHALSRFFIQGLGPAYGEGDLETFSFLINMDKLFEQFAAQWFHHNVPSGWVFKAQEQHWLGTTMETHFDIDLVWRNAESGTVICVGDTKNKLDVSPGSSDVQQVTAYAAAMKCNHAFLIYPFEMRTVSFPVGEHVIVHCVGFSLDGDLNKSGSDLLATMAKLIGASC